jgi:hypothetical protein
VAEAQPDLPDPLELAIDQAIAICDGDMRGSISSAACRPRSNLLSSGSVIAAKAWLLRLGQRLVSSGGIGARLAVVGTGYPVERAVVSIF